MVGPVFADADPSWDAGLSSRRRFTPLTAWPFASVVFASGISACTQESFRGQRGFRPDQPTCRHGYVASYVADLFASSAFSLDMRGSRGRVSAPEPQALLEVVPEVY